MIHLDEFGATSATGAIGTNTHILGATLSATNNLH